MDDLIQQAFMHVQGVGEHVAAGHFDLVGPDGEIVLPRLWDIVVKPGMMITMHMWPTSEEPSAETSQDNEVVGVFNDQESSEDQNKPIADERPPSNSGDENANIDGSTSAPERNRLFSKFRFWKK